MQKNGDDKQRLWTGPYILLLVLSTFTSTAQQMVTPILSRHVQAFMSLSLSGVLIGVFAFTALLVRPASGLMADRLSKKRLLVFSTLLTGLCFFGYTLSFSTAAVFACRVLHGAAFSFSSTVLMSLASSYVPEKRMGEGIGYIGLSGTLAMALGPTLGLSITSALDTRFVFYTAAGLCLVCGLAMGFIRDQKPEAAPRRKIKMEDLFSMTALPMALLASVFSMGNGMVNSYLSLHAEARGVGNVSLFFIVSSVAMLAARPFSGRLNDKKGLSYIIYPAYLLAAVSMLLLADGSSLLIILVAGVLKAIGQGSSQPALQAECVRLLGREKSGVATSTYYAGADIGQTLGPAIGGAFSDSYGYSAMYYLAAVLMALAGAGYFFYRALQKKRVKQSNA